MPRDEETRIIKSGPLIPTSKTIVRDSGPGEVLPDYWNAQVTSTFNKENQGVETFALVPRRKSQT